MPSRPRSLSLADHVLADLQAQRDELLREFQHWQVRTGEPGALTQHRTQLVRITDILSALLSTVLAGGALALDTRPPTSTSRETGAPPVALGPLVTMRRPLGAVHFLWDFFRDKFAQRDTALYANHLNAADTLAWHLYEPFWDVVATHLQMHPLERTTLASPEALKEPPLTFYHVERTPYARPRSSVFRPAGLDAKDVEAYSQVLSRLPIPIIGLPWYQARRMPVLVFVGHEVGHIVYDDLGLDGTLRTLIKGLALPEPREEVWLAWREEAFCDVFGTLTLGTAYVEQLAVELAAEPSIVIGEPIVAKRPGSYPTRSLRIALCKEIVRRLALTVPANWFTDAFLLAGDSDVYGSDIEAVAGAMLEGPYPTLGRVGLPAVLPWSQDDEDIVDEVARASLAGAIPDAICRVRHWVAGAVRARLTDSTTYHQMGLDARLAERITLDFARDIRSDACDSVRARLSALMAPAAESAFVVPPSGIAERDRRLGEEMAHSLGLMT